MGFSEYTLVGNSMSLRLFPEIHFGFSGEPLPISSYFLRIPPPGMDLGKIGGKQSPKPDILHQKIMELFGYIELARQRENMELCIKWSQQDFLKLLFSGNTFWPKTNVFFRGFGYFGAPDMYFDQILFRNCVWFTHASTWNILELSKRYFF